jgi:hypothetical protein
MMAIDNVAISNLQFEPTRTAPMLVPFLAFRDNFGVPLSEFCASIFEFTFLSSKRAGNRLAPVGPTRLLRLTMGFV